MRLAQYYFVTADPAAGEVLDNWTAWLDACGRADGAGWDFPVNFSEYGFTYGARVSTVGLFGGGERVSVPLSWGGTRQAAVEADRSFRSGPVARVYGRFGIQSRENPHYEVRDERVGLTARVEHAFARVVRAGASGEDR